MEPCEELILAVKKSDADSSLYRTGQLMSEQVEVLQLTWIRLVALLGEYCNIPVKKWLDVMRDIREFIMNEEVEVRLGFVITGKLCLLFHSEGYMSFPKKTLAVMRGNVVGLFDECLLSEKGLGMFAGILPKPTNEREFCLKIISGLVLNWKKEKKLLLREALEYVCRKDYPITGDFVEVLWGFLDVFLRGSCEDARVLYQCFYKKKERSWRCGLLYGFHNLLGDNLGDWTEKEVRVIEHVATMSPELWKGFVKEKPVLTYELDKMAILDSFMPAGKGRMEEGGGGGGGFGYRPEEERGQPAESKRVIVKK